MISLEGLTLITGRHIEAGWILRTFAHYVRDGLIPNMFPEGEKQGLYHTADATLWFFHAIAPLPRRHRRPRSRCALLLPTLIDIVEHHLAGTRFGIGVDPADGLLRQGERGLSAHLDGRQGGRLGGHAAPRQGGRDQRALVQRAAAAGGLGRAKHRRRCRGRVSAHADAERARTRSTRASGIAARRLSVSTSSTATAATTPPAAPTSSSPSRCDIPVLDRDHWRAVSGRGTAAAADSGRPPLARARPPRLQAAILRRPASARCRLSPGHGLGLADRPLHRRLAARSIRTTAPAPAASSTASRSTSSEACVGSISEIFDAEPRSRRAAASPRPGASPKCCDAGSKLHPASAPGRRRERIM